ncbi:DNA-binding protein HU-beta [Methylomagnum ishizawai]|uniref:Viral histone-like protein n=1 Tax=Methylomagnum ishizawai TaxID=1760988 RepID=A0A1Y6CUR8_9GAMM|nr:HU family DNA-binding protein [Methylomagnum ishizawai]SMF93950.1 DNA-binding protein HU-beta [Methylomagnum ishizawai]
MTRAELIAAFAAESDLSKTKAKVVLEDLERAIETGLQQDGEIPFLGKLKVEDKPERQGRNPSTGAVITVPASRKVKFKPSKTLLDSLNA